MSAAASARADRLIRWYPRAWRQRYGEEFGELLIADLRERPRCAARTFDIARGGLLARLTAAGLAGGALEPEERLRASLAAMGAALALFLPFGVGGRPWADKTLVPGGLASFAWAATLSITSYWAHPDRLGAFPTAEIGWMALAPVAIVAMAVGAINSVRRVALSPRMIRHEARVGRAATIAMLVFLTGGITRVVTGDTGPRRLFAFGAIDVLDVAVMSLAVIAALGIDRRLRITARLTFPPT
jgi:hypothetical protein